MTHPLISSVEKDYQKTEKPTFKVGDTVKVSVLIREGKKERTQVFEGIIVAIKGRGINLTFTVRRIFQGVGVERVFSYHSPKVQKVKVVRTGKTRRSKIYFLRDRIGSKATRLQEVEGAQRAKRDAEAQAVVEAAAKAEAEKKAAEEAAAKAKADAEAKAKAEEEAKAAEAAKAEEKPAEEPKAEDNK